MNPWQLLVLALESAVQTVGVRAGVEQPEYRTLQKAGPLELREYPPRIVAETTVMGNAEAARNAGFRRVAAYIFGANRGHQEVAMTSPVVQRG
ncbi:MAG TPA: heme-binding protein, partial [Caulobacteraceae bacterium]|nr:heme-binding protein [Caulobacteraceae bacterium]